LQAVLFETVAHDLDRNETASAVAQAASAGLLQLLSINGEPLDSTEWRMRSDAEVWILPDARLEILQ
jgi:hypothetical protein